MFVQVIELRTDRVDDIRALEEEEVAATEGQRSATRILLGRDRTDANHYYMVVEFPSYEDAMRNSQLPATHEAAGGMRGLCTEAPAFVDLDVVADTAL